MIHPGRLSKSMSEVEPIDTRAAPATVASNAVLEARALSKRYGDVEAVAGLDLCVGPSEIYCLLGPNGAGKTTTIHLFLGFLEPTAGSVHVTGLDVAAEPVESKRRLAYIPEQVMLYRNLSGLENLEYFAALGGRGSLAPERLTDILVGAGLPRDAVRRRVSDYSKGHAPEGRHRHRHREGGRRAAARRADVRTGPASLERVLRAARAAPGTRRRGTQWRRTICFAPRRPARVSASCGMGAWSGR